MRRETIRVLVPYSTAKTSTDVFRLVDGWKRLCAELEKITTSQSKHFIQNAKSVNVVLPDKFAVHLVFYGRIASAEEPHSKTRLDLAEWEVPKL